MHSPVFIALPVREDAGLQPRDQRGVVGQNSQFPAEAGRNDFIDLLAQDQPFGRDYFEIELVCHNSVGSGEWGTRKFLPPFPTPHSVTSSSPLRPLRQSTP